MAQDNLFTLLRNGASPWEQIPGRFGNFLQLAAYYGKQEELIELLVPKNGKPKLVDVNAISEMLPSVSHVVV